LTENVPIGKSGLIGFK